MRVDINASRFLIVINMCGTSIENIFQFTAYNVLFSIVFFIVFESYDCATRYLNVKCNQLHWEMKRTPEK